MVRDVPCRDDKVDAYVVFPGLGETWRLTHAIKRWQSLEAANAKYFLVAGHNREEAYWIKLDSQKLSLPPFNMQRTKGVIIKERAKHTKEQADWVVRKVKELDISSLALFVPSYHLLRAYGTVLKSLIEAEIKIPMIPAPTPVPPDRLVPETGVTAWEMVPGEAERYLVYMGTDVATYGELRDYINWLWKQDLLGNDHE